MSLQALHVTVVWRIGVQAETTTMMTRPTTLRKPRQEIPDDIVSCPPTLNLKKASGRRTMEFVSQLVKMSPQLAEINISGDEDSVVQSTVQTSVISDINSTYQSTIASQDIPIIQPKRLNARPKVVIEKEVPTTRQYKSTNRPITPQLPEPASRQQRHSPVQAQPQDRSKRSKGATHRSNRIASLQQQHRESSHPLIQPPSGSNNRGHDRRTSSVHSIHSSLVSWDSMSQSVYSVYSTASIIARRPAWGHYVVGILVFVGWVLHHMYFSEFFQQPIYVSSFNIENGEAENLWIDVTPDANPSMLRGAIKDSAIYRTQDFEHRKDFEAVKPISEAFDTIDGEQDSGGPPPVIRNQEGGVAEVEEPKAGHPAGDVGAKEASASEETQTGET